MALIVEDGSIVANANSYVTLDEIKDYADLRGFSYCSDGDLTNSAILATDYLQSKCFIGELVDPVVQPLLWPRSDVWLYGVELPSDSIPNDIKNAQIELTLANSESLLLTNGTESGDNVKKEKAEQLETEYYEGGKSSTFTSQRVNLYLQKFLKPLSLLRK